ncbi:MAG TPA: family 20 glycosylhydrolase, partial [Acidobacteriota bacterium]|nr:family 20 glycosylhydrolase [Acidobacteriota bacterium]
MNRSAGRFVWVSLFMLSAAGFAAGRGATGKDTSTPRMRGFHIDMNISQFTGPYLKKELKMLADLGYDTIIWEVENNIKWETCPECVSPDAFSKAEFKEILAYSRGLGLEPIPLLQTIGHCEYVLKHAPYKPLAEVPDRIDQYCPQNPAVVPFLRKWIEEYLEVFGNVRHFNLGADEAYTLGECPRCRAYAAAHSLSALYIDHINAVSQPLIAKGIRPVIWGDMLLHHPEALDSLSRKVVIFDWLYDRYYGFGKVQIWGRGELAKDELDTATLARFGPYLYPLGDEPGRDPDPFYTADYLAAHGFEVVVCPSSSCYGDSVFAPRTYFHMRNTYDSFRKGMSGRLDGAVLTSWTVHLFPWELQRTSIELPKFIAAHPDGDLGAFEKAFVQEHFGVDHTGFFAAAGRLANRGLFNYAADLGFFKDAMPAPRGYVEG